MGRGRKVISPEFKQHAVGRLINETLECSQEAMRALVMRKDPRALDALIRMSNVSGLLPKSLPLWSQAL